MEQGGDEELPLGQEFQDHIAAFIASNESDPRRLYENAGILVKYLK